VCASTEAAFVPHPTNKREMVNVEIRAVFTNPFFIKPLRPYLPIYSSEGPFYIEASVSSPVIALKYYSISFLVFLFVPQY